VTEPADGFSFRLQHTDATCAARRGTLFTLHGAVELPAFMPVGTQATVKGLLPEMVVQTGAQMILGNTYHLALRPGAELVAELGGLHAFMGWRAPILTDSGGFQIFSLAQQAQVSESEVLFRSHIDGSLMHLSPERAVDLQQRLGSDIAMVLDHVVPLPSAPAQTAEACQRTVRWAERCRKAKTLATQAQFAIVQGGLDEKLRGDCARELVAMDFEGYAIGGLSVGESPPEMYRVLDFMCPRLPADKPRYLMGVGRPQDLLEAIRRGVDMFDCVLPTRNGRNALAFTDAGPLRLRNVCHRDDPRPLDEHTDSPARFFSRAYIRHLFQAGEMLGPILLTLHNLTYYQRLMAESRQAIEQNRFLEYFATKMAGWQPAADVGDEAQEMP
jgi:queuine tRNA-ribosyltransferase